MYNFVLLWLFERRRQDLRSGSETMYLEIRRRKLWGTVACVNLRLALP